MDTLEKRAEQIVNAIDSLPQDYTRSWQSRAIPLILSALTDAREEGKRAQTEGLPGTAASGDAGNKSTASDALLAIGEFCRHREWCPQLVGIAKCECGLGAAQEVLIAALFDVASGSGVTSAHTTKANEKTGVEGTREAGAVRREDPKHVDVTRFYSYRRLQMGAPVATTERLERWHESRRRPRLNGKATSI